MRLRKSVFMRLSCAVTLAIALGAGAAPAGDAPGFKVTHRLKVGGEGRWDYVTIDAAGERLYVPRSDHVLILGASDGKQLGRIDGTRGVHGVALVPGLGRGYTSDGTDNTVTIFDLKSFAVIGKVKTAKKPDAILYDPASKMVVACDNGGDALTVFPADIDPAKTPAGHDIALGGAPESAVSDGNGQLFVNLEDKNEVVRVDTKAMTVTARWPLAGGEEPTGLAFDAKTRRLFSACHNKKMIVLNADTGAVVADLPIGDGVDAAAFDPELKLAFASNGDGTLTVVRELAGDKFEVAETVQTARGARTMALDPARHRLYLATAELEPAPATTPQQPRSRPVMLPDSFNIVVVER